MTTTTERLAQEVRVVDNSTGQEIGSWRAVTGWRWNPETCEASRQYEYVVNGKVFATAMTQLIIRKERA